MKTLTLSVPLLFLVAGTRAMLGAGIGLLVADRLASRRRRAIGAVLAGVGVVSTPFLARAVFFRQREPVRVLEEETIATVPSAIAQTIP